jgi:hypothetical protein
MTFVLRSCSDVEEVRINDLEPAHASRAPDPLRDFPSLPPSKLARPNVRGTLSRHRLELCRCVLALAFCRSCRRFPSWSIIPASIVDETRLLLQPARNAPLRAFLSGSEDDANTVALRVIRGDARVRSLDQGKRLAFLQLRSYHMPGYSKKPAGRFLSGSGARLREPRY